ncbi:MAG: glycosyltransferase family 2 protein [Gammaproteobacteria bacterium]|nr:glycosyltransferase family 2 protein [Gammaproteobacteria bacterium]
MPVYNGELWLRASLDSILNQTLSNFALVICDNASTDATPTIAKEYALKDSRIQYHRNDNNIGVYRNYNLTFSFARSKYFKWASSNDLCRPEFLEKCVDILETEPDAVLAYPKTMVFKSDENDAEAYVYDPEIIDESPYLRFRDTLAKVRLSNMFNGVIVTDVLRKTSLNRVHAGSDVVLLAELALYGKLRQCDEYLFFRRMHPTASSATKDEGEAVDFFSAEDRDVFLTPSWDFYSSCLRVAVSAPLYWFQRLQCIRYVLKRYMWGRKMLMSESLRWLRTFRKL